MLFREVNRKSVSLKPRQFFQAIGNELNQFLVPKLVGLTVAGYKFNVLCRFSVPLIGFSVLVMKARGATAIVVEAKPHSPIPHPIGSNYCIHLGGVGLKHREYNLVSKVFAVRHFAFCNDTGNVPYRVVIFSKPAI